MKMNVGQTTKARRRSIWDKMVKGKLPCRWTKIAVRVGGKFASKFVVGAEFENKLIKFGQFNTLDGLKVWSFRRGLTPVNGMESVA